MKESVLLLFSLISVFVQAQQKDTFGILTGIQRELKIPQVIIGVDPVVRDDINQEDSEGIELQDAYGSTYRCSIGSTQQTSVMEEESTQQTVDELENIQYILDSVEGLCLKQNDGFWTYQLCGQEVKQFHKGINGVIGLKQDIGFLEPKPLEVSVDNTLDVRQQTYVARQFMNGSLCDITGQPRTAEIRYFCELSCTACIDNIEEVSTCTYVIHVGVAALCQMPSFQRKNEQSEAMTCRRVPTPSANLDGQLSDSNGESVFFPVSEQQNIDAFAQDSTVKGQALQQSKEQDEEQTTKTLSIDTDDLTESTLLQLLGSKDFQKLLEQGVQIDVVIPSNAEELKDLLDGVQGESGHEGEGSDEAEGDDESGDDEDYQEEVM